MRGMGVDEHVEHIYGSVYKVAEEAVSFINAEKEDC